MGRLLFLILVMMYIITLLSDEWETYRGAKIGMTVDEVIKMYGEPNPEISGNGCMYYYNDDFDHLEIAFYADKKNIVRRIVISMGT